MAADYKHLNRLLEIYTLIEGSRGWTAKKLAERFKTTTRTIFRDIEVLKTVGIPVNHDPEQKCYTVGRDYYMRPLEMTFHEALALISLGGHIHDQHQIPFSHPALTALAKLRSQLPLKVRNELDLTEDHIAVKLAASVVQEGFEAYYEKVRQALAIRTCLRCKYESASRPDGTEPEFFLLKPYALFFNQRAWYVVGYHGLKDEIRTFKLNRFADMQSTSQKYTLPNSFTLEKYLGNAWRMIRYSYDVELRFDRDFAETITDTAWHRTQEHQLQPDGSVIWTCTVDGLDEIVWWILSMGAHCTVLQPPELVERVRTEAANTLALYGDAGHDIQTEPRKLAPSSPKH